MADLLLIGVGNPFRRDDAVGLLVARALKVLPGTHVVQCSGEGTEIMHLLESKSPTVIVDAVNSGQPPGTIHRLDARQPIPSDFFNYSTHAFSVAEAIEMMRVLGTLPPRVVLLGIEGADFTAGEGLSDAVESRYSDLVDATRAELAALLDYNLEPAGSCTN